MNTYTNNNAIINDLEALVQPNDTTESNQICYKAELVSSMKVRIRVIHKELPDLESDNSNVESESEQSAFNEESINDCVKSLLLLHSKSSELPMRRDSGIYMADLKTSFTHHAKNNSPLVDCKRSFSHRKLQDIRYGTWCRSISMCKTAKPQSQIDQEIQFKEWQNKTV